MLTSYIKTYKNKFVYNYVKFYQILIGIFFWDPIGLFNLLKLKLFYTSLSIVRKNYIFYLKIIY